MIGIQKLENKSEKCENCGKEEDIIQIIIRPVGKMNAQYKHFIICRECFKKMTNYIQYYDELFIKSHEQISTFIVDGTSNAPQNWQSTQSNVQCRRF